MAHQSFGCRRNRRIWARGVICGCSFERASSDAFLFPEFIGQPPPARQLARPAAIRRSKHSSLTWLFAPRANDKHENYISSFDSYSGPDQISKAVPGREVLFHHETCEADFSFAAD